MLKRITPEEQIKQPEIKTDIEKINEAPNKTSKLDKKSIEDEMAENADLLKEQTAEQLFERANSTQTPQLKTQESSDNSENNTEKVFNLIKKLDKSYGANIEDVIEESGIANCEDIIEALLNEGEIFEVKPGHLKVLE